MIYLFLYYIQDILIFILNIDEFWDLLIIISYFLIFNI